MCGMHLVAMPSHARSFLHVSGCRSLHGLSEASAVSGRHSGHARFWQHLLELAGLCLPETHPYTCGASCYDTARSNAL